MTGRENILDDCRYIALPDDEHAELASSMHVSAKEMRSFVLQLLVWLLQHLQADSLGSSHAAAAVAYRKCCDSMEHGLVRIARSFGARGLVEME